jgi:hypothetical protein
VGLVVETNSRFLTDIGKCCRWVRNDTLFEFVAAWNDRNDAVLEFVRCGNERKERKGMRGQGGEE